MAHGAAVNHKMYLGFLQFSMFITGFILVISFLIDVSNTGLKLNEHTINKAFKQAATRNVFEICN